MNLSRIALDTKRRSTMQALTSPHILHGAIETSLTPHTSEGRERTLWRVDFMGEQCYLLVLSFSTPDLRRVAEQFGYGTEEYKLETRDYSQLMIRIQADQKWRFRLRANPVRSSPTTKDSRGRRGKLFAHVTQDQQRAWLMERAETCGFSLAADAFDIVHTEWKTFLKASGHTVTLRVADYEGILTIKDSGLFRNALISGIGRAKAYGCGLLTIVRGS